MSENMNCTKSIWPGKFLCVSCLLCYLCILYNLYFGFYRFYDLENGEVLDLRYYDDLGFYHFLHTDFKKKYVVAETKDIFSITLE